MFKGWQYLPYKSTYQEYKVHLIGYLYWKEAYGGKNAWCTAAQDEEGRIFCCVVYIDMFGVERSPYLIDPISDDYQIVSMDKLFELAPQAKQYEDILKEDSIYLCLTESPESEKPPKEPQKRDTRSPFAYLDYDHKWKEPNRQFFTGPRCEDLPGGAYLGDD